MALVEMPLLTAEDYRDLPETGPRYQLIEGDLYMAPAPNRYHQEISRNLELILGYYLKAHPIGKIYDAPFDVELDEHNVFQPDILFISAARYSILTEAGASGAPDLVVEILSPKTSKLDLVQKRRQYARAGVLELWIIDPKQRQIHLFQLQEEPNTPAATYDERTVFESPMFPGLHIHAAEVFAE